MRWRIEVSNNAEKFLLKNTLSKEKVFNLIRGAIRYFSGEDINVDIKKLGGKWFGFYRIRKGKVRIIVGFDFANSVVFIEEIDWRGNIYK